MSRAWGAALCALVVALPLGVSVAAQTIPGVRTPATQPQAEPPKDTLGRDTPRGTVLGFMIAARRGDNQAAPLYLNTPLRDSAAEELARQLYVVLDTRLPARLNELSDLPEGSLPNPLKPDEDIVGTVNTAEGPVQIVVERVNRGALGRVWLFSRKTLARIPDVYDEVDLVAVDRYLPDFLKRSRVAGIRLFEWLVFLLAIPLFYVLAGVASRLLRPLLAVWHRRYGAPDRPSADRLPGYVRLLLLVVAIRWIVASLELPLLERQFWSGVTTVLTIAAVVWILLRASAIAEGYLLRRLHGANFGEAASLLRLVRRLIDGLVILSAFLINLRWFGVDATAALAGLGIGGIAVALAAQKTLENVIGGLSLIFDKAVRVGDHIKLGEAQGTVDYIGLRSTRIRTLDRTVLTVPNGQVSAVGIETLSARDKFWFHHFLGLVYETTPAQMRLVIEGVSGLLASYPGVDKDSIRARFFRLGSVSLDVELFAYIYARDWERFLEIQEELLLRVIEIVQKAGTEIALPSQTLRVSDSGDGALLSRRIGSVPVKNQ